MGTTLDDVYADMAYEAQAKEEEKLEIIRQHKIYGIKIERAKEIFKFLPIYKELPENDYIIHLWDAYLSLDSFGENGWPFLVMPFHLLFMMSLQYKVLRLTWLFPKPANLIFSTTCGRNKSKLLPANRSVFDIGYMNERMIPEFFQLINLNSGLITRIKKLIDDRNEGLAHAKGGKESDPGLKIDNYLDLLNDIQNCLNKINLDTGVNWVKEIDKNVSIVPFIENKFLKSLFSPSDYEQIALFLLRCPILSDDQFHDLITLGLNISDVKTLESLKIIVTSKGNNSKRFIAIEALNENGMISPELKTIILKKETDPKIKLFLK